MKTIRELLDERAQLINQARSLLDAVEGENRAMTSEEEQRYNKLLSDANALKSQVDRRQQLEQVEATLGGNAGETPRPNPVGQIDGLRTSRREKEEYRKAYMTYVRSGYQDPGLEMRDLQADSGPGGGYVLTPMAVARTILTALDDMVYMRKFGTVMTLDGAESLGVPTLDADPSDADWTPEVPATLTADSTMAFGRRELKPTLLTKLIKVSYRLLNRLPTIESFINGRLVYKFGVSMEKAYMTGTGAQQPLGVFVASNDGIPTTRDVATGNLATAITFDGLTEAKYSVKAQYRRQAKWLFHRDAVKQLAKIKDGEGQYMWQPSRVQGDPDMLMGAPLLESEYCPNTFTANLYVGLYGDLSYYWIADSLGISIQRLIELFALNNQVGLKAMIETDGMPVLAEAFARVKLGA